MKRDIFSKVVEVFYALANELLMVRERLKMSRPMFAMYLRTHARTLENWARGRAKPNAQATKWIRLVQKYPETAEHLAAQS